MIFTGVVSLLSLVTLRQAGAAGANAAALVTVGDWLLGLHPTAVTPTGPSSPRSCRHP